MCNQSAFEKVCGLGVIRTGWPGDFPIHIPAVVVFGCRNLSCSSLWSYLVSDMCCISVYVQCAQNPGVQSAMSSLV